MALFLVRHGETDFNDPPEKIRAWSDIPLNHNGEAAAEAAGELLLHFPIVQIVASDLQRTIMTAAILSEVLGGLPVKACRGLRPWNVGDLTGKPISEIAPELNRLQAHPNEKAPNGESYGEFYNRASETIEKLMAWVKTHPSKDIVAVTHSRELLALPTILGSKKIGDVPVKGGPAPGQIVRVTVDGDKYHMEVL